MAVAVVAASSFLTVATAAAAPFTVNSTADTGDAALNGTCDDGTGHCTLRAAMQEANNTAAADTISFDSTTFNGTTGATITVTSALPTLIHLASITSSGCTSGVLPKPCVAVKGDGTFDGITMGSGSSGSTVAGLDLFKLRTGVVDSDGGGTIQGNWFGIDLAGSPTSNANTNGVRVLGNSGTIGGTTAATRNVFANDSATGLSIEGGDSNTVTGNYFGTTPAGALDANLSNHDSIAVATLSADTAFGNTIGGADTNSNTACDGACNLLGNTVDDEIELSGSSVTGGSPAASTTILGNYVGLQLNGTDGSSANDFTGGSAAIETHIGSPTAEHTVVGGASPADRNYIGGNRTGIDTGQVTTSDTIENNYFGIQPDGSGTVPNLFQDMDVAGTNVSSGVLVKDNLVGGGSFSSFVWGIGIYGSHATIQGNTLGLDATGAPAPFSAGAINLESGGSAHDALIGGSNPGDGNVIAGGGDGSFGGGTFGSGGIAIAPGSSIVTIDGNSIGTDPSGAANYGNTGPGIEIQDNGGASSQVHIGLNAPNLISNSTGPAIYVKKARDVEIGENSGSGNGAPFIDLLDPAGLGNDNTGNGSANGLQAPAVSTPTATTLSGTSVAGATIRVYAKSTATLDGQLGALIGTGTADGGGSWTVTFTSSQSEFQRMVATQTRTGLVSKETSEASSVVRVPDTTPPVTTIDTQPPALTNDATPTLSFHATDVDPTITFTCQIDSGSANACSSGDTFGPLPDGLHTISVTAKDSSNNTETSPPSASFTIDTVAPVITLDSAPSGTTNDNTPTVSFHVTDASATSTTCQVDAGASGPCSSPATFGPLSDGAHTISVLATDSAGNAATPKTAAFTVNTAVLVPPSNTAVPPVKKCKKKKHRAASAKKCKKKKRK